MRRPQPTQIAIWNPCTIDPTTISTPTDTTKVADQHLVTKKVGRIPTVGHDRFQRLNADNLLNAPASQGNDDSNRLPATLSTATDRARIDATPAIPTSFKWNSTGALIGPRTDSYNLAGIKDPSVIYVNGTYHIFASTSKENAYNLVYLRLTDWAQANASTFHYLDKSGIGAGYRAAPQVFYFAPKSTWYLVYQNGNAAYSTNPNLSDPTGWSAPKTFFDSTPDTISNNIGSGHWVDMWVICDTSNCHLFSSDDNGHLYRSQTTLANFPSGFNEPVIAMRDPQKNHLFEASNVYKVSNQYLLIVEAIGSDGRRYFRSWTASGIAGPWTALADSEANPFARANNVVFSGTPWTKDISHGEMVRTVYDETMEISACDMRYLYQGMDPDASGSYNGLPWRLGLLTQSNSAC